jgi:hypothetical protein
LQRKAMSITYICARACLCVWAYLSSTLRAGAKLFPASLATPHFSTSHKLHDFGKKVTEHKMCVLIFCTTFISNISHSKKKTARYCHKYKNVYMHGTRYFCRILIKLEIFFNRLSKKSQISNLIKIRPVGGDVFHADRRKDIMKLTVAFRNFVNAPKKC